MAKIHIILKLTAVPEEVPQEYEQYFLHMLCKAY